MSKRSAKWIDILKKLRATLENSQGNENDNGSDGSQGFSVADIVVLVGGVIFSIYLAYGSGMRLPFGEGDSLV